MIKELIEKLEASFSALETKISAALRGDIAALESRVKALEGKNAVAAVPIPTVNVTQLPVVLPVVPPVVAPPVIAPPVAPVASGSLPLTVPCSLCLGGGTLTPSAAPGSTVTCPKCNGTGTMLTQDGVSK